MSRCKIATASILCAMFLTSFSSLSCGAEQKAQTAEEKSGRTEDKAGSQSASTKRELGERQTFKGTVAFSMRPPAGYELQTDKGENATTYAWAAKRADGTKSGVLVQTVNVPGGSDVNISDQNFLAKFLAEGSDAQSKMTSQEGTKEIEGRKFAIADFQRELPNGSKVVGYVYVTKVDNNNFCVMMAQDYPANKVDLDFVRSAHETFKIEQ